VKNYRIPTSLSEKLSTGLQGLSGDIPPAMQLSVSTIPGGAKGTKATLEQMKKITVGAVTDREHGAFLRGLAIKITREAGCDSKEHFCEAKALANWVRDEVRWIRDINGFETLQWPKRTLAYKAGDCDDLSILLAALAMSIGFQTYFKAIAANSQSKDQFSHVYVLISVGGKKVPADPTVKSAKFGWESPLSYRDMIVKV